MPSLSALQEFKDSFSNISNERSNLRAKDMPYDDLILPDKEPPPFDPSKKPEQDSQSSSDSTPDIDFTDVGSPPPTEFNPEAGDFDFSSFLGSLSPGAGASPLDEKEPPSIDDIFKDVGQPPTDDTALADDNFSVPDGLLSGLSDELASTPADADVPADTELPDETAAPADLGFPDVTTTPTDTEFPDEAAALADTGSPDAAAVPAGDLDDENIETVDMGGEDPAVTPASAPAADDLDSLMGDFDFLDEQPSADSKDTGAESGAESTGLGVVVRGIPGYRARIRPIVSRITIHWPSFYNVVTGKTLALPNLIALQHIPLSPAGVIAKRPAPIALPNSCAAEWRMAPDAVFSPYASVRYFTPHMVHSQYNLL